MMKIFLSFFLLVIIHSSAFAQAKDSLGLKDTLPVKDSLKSAGTLPVRDPMVKDTIPANDSSLNKALPSGDTLIIKADSTKIKADSTKKIAQIQLKDSIRRHSPRRATIRSAILPGWGQIYNRKYWKLPIVYGAIGFPAYLILDNKRWYDRSRYALSMVVNDITDSVALSKVHPKLTYLVNNKAQSSLVNYRNSFRKNMDYSVLFTLLMWGLNVVDATVDGHLKDFDVGDDLTLKISPTLIAGSHVPGLSFVVNFK